MKTKLNSKSCERVVLRQVLKLGLGSYFYMYISKTGSTEAVENMAVIFKVMWVTLEHL
jgi:hypothetical protein